MTVMTIEATEKRFRKRMRLGTAALLAVPVLIWTVVILIPADPDSLIGKRTRACDAAVNQLLNSKDEVEVRRAGIIVHELDCGIASRMPDK